VRAPTSGEEIRREIAPEDEREEPASAGVPRR
jgi:hypothetical protein